MENSGRVFVFSRPAGERLFINYADKIGIAVIVVTAAIDILFFPESNIGIRWLGVLLVMIALGLIMEIVGRRFAHRITIHTETGVLQFDMYRNVRAIEADLTKLKAVQIGFYISFVFEKRRVLYNEVVNKELISFLETLKPLLWRRAGRFLHKHG